MSLKIGVNAVYVEYRIWECAVIRVDLRVMLDFVSCLFLATVCIISGSVLVYCEWYIADEVFKRRFLGLVLSFVGSIICLIMIPNFFTLLIG